METKQIIQNVGFTSNLGVWLDLLDGRIVTFIDDSDAPFDLLSVLESEIKEHTSSEYADPEYYKTEWLDEAIDRLTKYREWVKEYKK